MKEVLKQLLIAALYFALAKICLSLSIASGNVSPVWPGSGIALGALVLTRLRFWPAIFLGAFTANATTDIPLWTAFALGIGNTSGAVVAALLLRRFHFNTPLSRSRDTVLLTILGAGLSTWVPALWGTYALMISKAVPQGEYWKTSLVWWTGDAVGVLVFGSFILSWAQAFTAPRAFFSRLQFNVEALLLLVVTLTGGIWIFQSNLDALEYLCFPILIWAALRFKERGASAVVLILSIIATTAASLVLGPFSDTRSLADTILSLQIFIAVCSVTSLLMASGGRALESNELTFERYLTALDAAQIAFWETNMRTGNVYRSELHDRIYGYEHPLPEWTHEMFLKSIHPDDRESVNAQVEEILKTNITVFAHNFRIITPKGDQRWITSRARIIRNEAGFPELVRGVIMDISQLKHTEEELQTALRVRDEFFSMASHELKTPLTSINLQIQLLERTVRMKQNLDTEQMSQRLDTATRQLERLSALIESLLDVSRIRNGKLQFEFSETDLTQIVRDVGQRFSEEYARYGISLSVRAPTSCLGVWDRLRIEQVISNLLSNALRYGNNAPVTLHLEDLGDRAQIIVIDQGPGIPIDDQPHIFDRFAQGSSARNSRGLGIGLYIVRQIVQGHKGKITLQSSPGNGARFEIELPKSAQSPSENRRIQRHTL